MVELLQYDAGGVATGLRQLAALPPRNAMAPPPHPGAAAGAHGAAGGDHGTADVPQDLPGEAWYRMLVTPWGRGEGQGQGEGVGVCADEGRNGVEGGGCLSPEEYFQRSSWGMPGLFSGELRPVGQTGVWRLYDEVRQMALECVEMMEDIGVEEFEDEEEYEEEEYGEGEDEEGEGEGEEVLGDVGAQEEWESGKGEGRGQGSFNEERQGQEEEGKEEVDEAAGEGEDDGYSGVAAGDSARPATRKRGKVKEDGVQGSLEEVE